MKKKSVENKDVQLAKNTMQMLVYQEAFDILVAKYVENFITKEELFNCSADYFEQELRDSVLEKAVNKISTQIELHYKNKKTTRKTDKDD